MIFFEGLQEIFRVIMYVFIAIFLRFGLDIINFLVNCM